MSNADPQITQITPNHLHNLRKEDELLLCCSRTTAAPEVTASIRKLAKTEIDWEYLFLIARRHSVVPLVYRQLEQHAAGIVPDDQLSRFKKHYLENSARNTLLTAVLSEVIELLSATGIEAIPYKGPVLALFAYGNLALRRFVDLDVIVRRADVLRARQVLLDQGYTPTKSLSLSQQELLLRTQHNMQFAHHNRQLLIELHWEVAPHLFASAVSGDKLWDNLITIDLNGTKINTLNAEDLLFSLCVHGSRHLWERLGWICDVAELLTRHRLDWPSLLERADNSNSERMFLLGLYLAERLLNAPLPDEVKQRCRNDKQLESLAANVVEHLFNGATHVPATSREIFKYNLAVRKSLGARARYLVHMLRPTDSDLSSRSIPRGFGFAYYLTRPFRILFNRRFSRQKP